MHINRNDILRVQAKADQATAMLRDCYAGLSMAELEELSNLADFLERQGKVGIVAAKTLFTTCAIERLRRASENVPGLD